MPCTYVSRVIRERFDDADILARAVERLTDEQRDEIIYSGTTVRSTNPETLNAVKQFYATEKAKAQAKKKGFFVKEQKQPNGKIVLTVRR